MTIQEVLPCIFANASMLRQDDSPARNKGGKETAAPVILSEGVSAAKHRVKNLTIKVD